MLFKLLVWVLSMLTLNAAFAEEIIDVHSHFLPTEYVESLEKEGRALDEGFPLPKYDASAHLKWMDEAGIQTSILTLAAPNPSSKESFRKTNEIASKLQKKNPDRFLFCAALPLPDVQAALDEARYAFDKLGANCVKLATNADGQYLGTGQLDPLFQYLNEKKAVIVLHPHRPNPVNRDVMAQTPLALQEYLSETTRAVTNMISRNVFARFKNLRLVVPHCGAYLPLAIPRMKSLVPVMQKNHLLGGIDWDDNLNALYFDLAGAHSPEVIRMILTITKPDHLLYGSDYPYVAPDVLKQSIERMKTYLSEEPDLAPYREMILSQNARALFGLSSKKAEPVQKKSSMLVRIAQIGVHQEFVEAYLAYANEVDRLSMEREPGVICLYPMQDAEDPTQFRILEIYASEEAYQKHLKTEHFLKYKQGTLHMVKSLELPNMKPLDPETMPLIFKKLR